MSQNNWPFLLELMNKLGGGVWKPYTYNSEPIVMDAVANVTPTFSVPLNDGKGFIWTHGLYKSNVAAVNNGTDTLYGGALIVFDEAGGFGQMTKKPGPIETFFSRGGICGGPLELTYPVAFNAGPSASGGNSTTIAGTLTNTSGGAQTIYLSFIGLRRY